MMDSEAIIHAAPLHKNGGKFPLLSILAFAEVSDMFGS